MIINNARRCAETVKHRVIHHFNYHRLFWIVTIGVTFMLLGWFEHNESFRKFAEFTLFPAIEAFVNRKLD